MNPRRLGSKLLPGKRGASDIGSTKRSAGEGRRETGQSKVGSFRRVAIIYNCDAICENLRYGGTNSVLLDQLFHTFLNISMIETTQGANSS